MVHGEATQIVGQTIVQPVEGGILKIGEPVVGKLTGQVTGHLLLGPHRGLLFAVEEQSLRMAYQSQVLMTLGSMEMRKEMDKSYLSVNALKSLWQYLIRVPTC